MADSWEDEDFEVPTIVVPTATSQWVPEDEEDNVVVETAPTVLPPTPAQIEALKKKAAEEDEKLAIKLKFAQYENETPEERKIRERRQAEEADAELAGDLVSGSAKKSAGGAAKAGSGSLTSGLGSVSLKTKEDHKSFGLLCSKKMSDSTSMNITFFYKSLFDSTKAKLTTESLDEILEVMSKVREERKKTEPVNRKAAAAAATKSKKQMEQEKKKHADVFGGSFEADQYDHYASIEDDFM